MPSTVFNHADEWKTVLDFGVSYSTTLLYRCYLFRGIYNIPIYFMVTTVVIQYSFEVLLGYYGFRWPISW